jgi:hypothetical protein
MLHTGGLGVLLRFVTVTATALVARRLSATVSAASVLNDFSSQLSISVVAGS